MIPADKCTCCCLGQLLRCCQLDGGRGGGGRCPAHARREHAQSKGADHTLDHGTKRWVKPAHLLVVCLAPGQHLALAVAAAVSVQRALVLVSPSGRRRQHTAFAAAGRRRFGLATTGCAAFRNSICVRRHAIAFVLRLCGSVRVAGVDGAAQTRPGPGGGSSRP
jgi:hypothetical protein